MLSTTIYIFCYWLLDIKNEDHLYFRLVTSSATGAVLLKLFYDLLVLKKITFMQTFVLPLTIGIGAAIPGALFICSSFWFRIDNLHLGIFSIYPFWYYGMGALIAHSIKQIMPSETITEQQ